MKDDNKVSNSSNNRPFQNVLEVNLQRRKILQGSLAAAVSTGFLGTFTANEVLAKKWPKALIDFTPVSLAQGGGIVPAISEDYEYDVILPWGDPLEPGGPVFNMPIDADEQTQQIGIGHDGMWYFPIRDGRRKRYGWDDDYVLDPWKDGYLNYGTANERGVLCMNNEFGTNFHVLRKSIPETLEDVRVSQHAHGVTIVELKCRRNGKWRTKKGDLGRRIHVNSPVRFSGPAEGHPLLENPIGNVPLGTVNNCAMGYTPWGTYLTCEENFNGYFGTGNPPSGDPTYEPTARQRRYGFDADGFDYYWHLFDKRFDLADPDYVNESNRFGWVVEIDPMDPNQIPVKRTALGRKKNEGATVHVADDGRLVVYNGDDERFDYVYKFVSADDWRTMRKNGESPLDRGTLFVARFYDDGNGEWLPLTLDNPDLAAEFNDLGEMLINTRIAADIVGATPMDRPEWITVANDGLVYMSLTNNSVRDNTGFKDINGRLVDSGPNGANPRTPNADGHIIRWNETAGHCGTTFSWDIFIFTEDTHGTEESFADPDGLWADPDGRLFIQTDGGQKDGLNNQMLVANLSTGEVKRLLTGVPGCEITGITATPDQKTMFINVQHPGNGDPSVSNFPAEVGSGEIPRDATIVITRKNHDIVGS